jgi:hypothetical protein
VRSSTRRDDPGRRRALAWALAGVATVTLLATALWLYVAVLPRKLYASLSASDLAGSTPLNKLSAGKVAIGSKTTLAPPCFRVWRRCSS